VHNEFYYLTNEALEVSEEYPKFLCVQCYADLNKSFKFKNLCLESQEKLRNLDKCDDEQNEQSENEFDATVKEEPEEEFDIKIEPSLESFIQDMEVADTEISLEKDTDEDQLNTAM
jgi:hypothetical protein